MPRRKLPTITPTQWRAAIDAYELGYSSLRQIARDFGVSPATVSRRFRVMGAVKACRVGEAMAPVIAEIDRRAKERSMRKAAQWEAACALSMELSALMENMMAAILAADRVGNVALAATAIVNTKAAMSGR